MAKLRRTAISRSTVGRLKADGDTVFWDSELQGFGVRVYASGRKIYVVQTRAGGPHPRRAAMAHDTPPTEFVRETILALARNPESGVSGAVGPSLAPLIERMFRYTWFLATEKRDAMVREGREDEVDALVAEARGLHDELRRGVTDQA